MSIQSRRPLGRLAVLTLLFAIVGPGAGGSAQAETSLEPSGVLSRHLAQNFAEGAVSESIPDAAQAPQAGQPAEPAEESQGLAEAELAEPEDYDPWESFNERMFAFNRQLDRYAVKPAAKGWDAVLPDGAQRGLNRAFTNFGFPVRFVNSLFQLKLGGAGREVARFLLNSTAGIGGFFDMAKTVVGLEPSNEDTGQTLGSYGVGPGPYLVLPFLPPMTVRDGIGFGVDVVLNPVTVFFAPAVASVGMNAGDTVNDRSLNLEVFEDVEESALDLYSAVRNGYLQRRQKAIQE